MKKITLLFAFIGMITLGSCNNNDDTDFDTISEVFEDYIGNDKIKNVANRLLFLSAIIIPLLTIKK